MDAPLTAVTVGTFDGLHRGHAAVLGQLSGLARAEGLRPLAVTFDRHPLEVVAPRRAPQMLMTPDARDAAIRSLGVDVRRVAFTEALRRTTAAGWLRRLHDDYGARLVLLGYDNTFGCDGLELGVEGYAAEAARLGMRLEVGKVLPGCSSSAIRRALLAGDTAAASQMLGHPYVLEGEVRPGRQLGRTIGVPTANVATDPRILIPSPGVYAATATAAGRDYPAVVNIGPRPTVSDSPEVTVEAHLIGFDGDLYGKTLPLAIGPRLRDIRKFDNLALLEAQIRLDIAQAQAT